MQEENVGGKTEDILLCFVLGFKCKKAGNDSSAGKFYCDV